MNGRDDLKSFFSLGIEENMDALYGVALRLTGNSTDAQDLVAEAVSRAWTGISSLSDRRKFRSWIFSILRNCFISDYRKKSVRPVETGFGDVFDDEGESDIESLLHNQSDDFLKWWAQPEREFFNSLLGEQLMNAIDDLPEAFRVTVLLINVEGLTYDEAAEALGVPSGTIRSRMKRGRTLLQKALWMYANNE